VRQAQPKSASGVRQECVRIGSELFYVDNLTGTYNLAIAQLVAYFLVVKSLYVCCILFYKQSCKVLYNYFRHADYISQKANLQNKQIEQLFCLHAKEMMQLYKRLN
jgi:hypothetical protein